ncbi:hypothetical protein CFB84_30880 [Burkholderia aenigmatica]|uniref:Uncharacterized protein n=1 Tax=Burkholderia aenigmatica TaxID=2015348 RepID=A0A228I406_9BURK|nr:hypothetical protein CFB84_30880 [Burkholderia aenigmatica]
MERGNPSAEYSRAPKTLPPAGFRALHRPHQQRERREPVLARATLPVASRSARARRSAIGARCSVLGARRSAIGDWRLAIGDWRENVPTMREAATRFAPGNG